MITRAIAKYIRVSPRKTRKVANLIKGKPVVKAEILLDTIGKRPSIYIKRLLRSAIDSADKRFSIAAGDLYISSIKADCGPTLKRYRAASMGRATMIKHRTTHITLELDKIKRPEKKITEQPTKAKSKKNVRVKSKKGAKIGTKSTSV